MVASPARIAVCVLTGTRAEYGLLRPLLRRIQDSSRLTLQTIVTGAHLSTEFGSTWQEIADDGFELSERVEIVGAGDSALDTCRSLGAAVTGVGEALSRLNPSLLVLLGDRYETFAAAAAATVLNIPIAHLHGGELTEGSIDDAFRHAVTKMAHLHFTATEEYRARVIRMGEDPSSVHNTGAIGLDAIRELAPMTLEEIGASLGYPLRKSFLLVTFHPETADGTEPISQLDGVLDGLIGYDGHQLLITGANADAGGRAINGRIAEWRDRVPDRICFMPSLGQRRYLSAMRLCDAVIGNSSSGIIEAPSFAVPTIDIGRRQQGRMRALSVLHAEAERQSLHLALDRARDLDFLKKIASQTNPYGNGTAAVAIADLIEQALLIGMQFAKRFHD